MMRGLPLPLTIAITIIVLAFAGLASAADYQKMEVVDIKLDARSLEGKKVEISGFMAQVMTIPAISNTAYGVSIYVDPTSLSREERRAIMVNCTNTNCRARLRGVVKMVSGPGLSPQWGIVADSVEVSPR